MQEKVYLCSVKRKERLIWLLKWLLLLAAYSYLAYRLAAYRDYPALWQQLRATDAWGWGCLAGCLLLMPLNLLLEALKWRTLLAGICPLSVAEAQRQVYYGFVGAFVTPYRLGDYPARATRLPDPNRWKEAVAMGMYGSIVLTLTIVLTGWIPAFCFFAGEASGNLHLMSVIVLAGGLPICLLPLLKRWSSGVTPIVHRVSSLLSLHFGLSTRSFLFWSEQRNDNPALFSHNAPIIFTQFSDND